MAKYTIELKKPTTDRLDVEAANLAEAIEKYQEQRRWKYESSSYSSLELEIRKQS